MQMVVITSTLGSSRGRHRSLLLRPSGHHPRTPDCAGQRQHPVHHQGVGHGARHPPLSGTRHLRLSCEEGRHEPGGCDQVCRLRGGWRRTAEGTSGSWGSTEMRQWPSLLLSTVHLRYSVILILCLHLLTHLDWFDLRGLRGHARPSSQGGHGLHRAVQGSWYPCHYDHRSVYAWCSVLQN